MDSEKVDIVPRCLNCGSLKVENYCSHCGQKVQSTKVPLRDFLTDALDSVLNIDNRLFRTVEELFVKPGEVTQRYIAGERVKYVSPMRLYIWVSVIYFVLVTLIDTNRFFLINIDLEGREKSFGNYLQYSMFLLLPIFALIVWLVHKGQKRLYVEHLIFGVHLHVVWYALSIVYTLCELALTTLSLSDAGGWIFGGIQTLTKAGILIYLILYIKKVYQEAWWVAFLKTWAVIMMYSIVLLLISIIYTTLI